MIFDQPLAFWALGALAVLLLFSLWRQRPTRHGVSSIVLWRRIPDRVPPVRAARKPRMSASLLLQALAVAAIIAALAEPFLLGLGRPPRRVIVVLDTSARMQARRRAGGTRFEIARERALIEAGDLRSMDSAVLYWGDVAPHRWEGLGDELGSRLRSVQPADHAVAVEPLMHEATDEARRSGGAEIWLISDRPGGNPSAREFLAGELADNTGIVEFTAEDHEVFARIDRYGDSRDVSIVLKGDERELARETIHLDRGSNSWTRKVDLAQTRNVSLTLETADQLPIDNFASAVRFNDKIPVALVGNDHPNLSRILSIVSGGSLRRGGSAPITVLHQILNPSPLQGLVVYVDPPAAPEGFRLGVRVLQPTRFTVMDHPLTSGMKAGELSTLSAREVDGGEPILQADGRTVAAVRRDGPLTRIVLALELSGGWLSKPSFPIFWSNVIELSGFSGAWKSLRAGRPEMLPRIFSGVKSNGGRITFDPASGRFLASNVGSYLANSPAGDIPFSVSLLDPTQTDTEGLAREGALEKVGGKPTPVRTPLATYACAAALLFVLGAWLAERRRG